MKFFYAIDLEDGHRAFFHCFAADVDAAIEAMFSAISKYNYDRAFGPSANKDDLAEDIFCYDHNC